MLPRKALRPRNKCKAPPQQGAPWCKVRYELTLQQWTSSSIALPHQHMCKCQVVKAYTKSSPLHTLHSRMGKLNGRTRLSLGLLEQWYMIRNVLYFCGLRLALLLFTYRIGVLTKLWRTLLQRRISRGRSLSLRTYVYLGMWHILRSPRRRELN